MLQLGVPTEADGVHQRKLRNPNHLNLGEFLLCHHLVTSPSFSFRCVPTLVWSSIGVSASCWRCQSQNPIGSAISIASLQAAIQDLIEEIACLRSTLKRHDALALCSRIGCPVCSAPQPHVQSQTFPICTKGALLQFPYSIVLCSDWLAKLVRCAAVVCSDQRSSACWRNQGQANVQSGSQPS